MKLRYYLRGLGIGIFVTALIMIIATGDNGAMTDEEIIQRATELGMVTSRTLMENAQENGGLETERPVEPMITEAPTAGEQEPPASVETEILQESEAGTEALVETEIPQEPEAGTEVPVETAEPEVTEVPVEENTSEPTEVPIESSIQEEQTGEKVTLTVYSGEHSATVAKRMEELGLIEDYLDFDNYLCDNGYSRYVNSGVYKIKHGMTYEELAKIITRTN